MMSSSKATAQIQNENSDKNDDVFLNMEFNEDEMKFPIKSEEQVCKERKLDVNGMLFYEKRVARETCDGSDTKFLLISILRKIGNRTYKTSELFKNGESQGQKCNLKGDEKQDFESDWKKDWKPNDSTQDSGL